MAEKFTKIIDESIEKEKNRTTISPAQYLEYELALEALSQEYKAYSETYILKKFGISEVVNYSKYAKIYKKIGDFADRFNAKREAKIILEFLRRAKKFIIDFVNLIIYIFKSIIAFFVFVFKVIIGKLK